MRGADLFARVYSLFKLYYSHFDEKNTRIDDGLQLHHLMEFSFSHLGATRALSL